jgi:hypothetical protein
VSGWVIQDDAQARSSQVEPTTRCLNIVTKVNNESF